MVMTAGWCFKVIIVVLLLAMVLSGVTYAFQNALDGRWGAATLQLVGTSIFISVIVKFRPSSPTGANSP